MGKDFSISKLKIWQDFLDIKLPPPLPPNFLLQKLTTQILLSGERKREKLHMKRGGNEWYSV